MKNWRVFGMREKGRKDVKIVWKGQKWEGKKKGIDTEKMKRKKKKKKKEGASAIQRWQETNGSAG